MHDLRKEAYQNKNTMWLVLNHQQGTYLAQPFHYVITYLSLEFYPDCLSHVHHNKFLRYYHYVCTIAHLERQTRYCVYRTIA